MNPKAKYLLIGLIVGLLIVTAAWKMFGASATGAAKQFLLQTASSSINGTLSVGDVEFSLPGSLVARQVELKDKSGALIAAAKTLTLDLDVSDLLSRSFDISRIRKLSFDGLILNLNRDKERRWNVTEALPKSSAAPLSIFRGMLVASNATVTILMAENRYEFKNVDGTIDFAKHPDLSLDLKAKSGSASITAKGLWNFSGGGNIQVSVDRVEPASYSPNIPLTGALTTNFVLSGTTDKPTATGTFQNPSGSAGAIAFTDAAGDFSLSGSTLSLSNTRMNALGGSLTASGPIYLDTLRYVQKVSGQNIDSAHLSDRDIHGRINFQAEAQGQGAQPGISADGAFQMGAGSISGVTFEALTGNFSKRGSYTRYYNIRVTIAGQTIYIGDADSLEALKIPFLNLTLPGMLPGTLPGVPQTPQLPSLPKVPSLPKLF